MTGNEVEASASADQSGGDDSPSPQWREYRTGGITVRMPAEPPTLTPRAARALLEIIKELSDKKLQKRTRCDAH